MQTTTITLRDILRSSLIVLGVGCVLVYILYQARFLIVGPQVTLHTDISSRQNERVVTLSGSAQNISRLWLNGRPTFTDPNGKFAADVVLENGYTIATLTAEDRYGRTTSLTREFVYVPMSFSYQSN